jgi:hypothetical protein
MTRIFVPSRGPDDWQAFLAEPNKQWRVGYSARSLAYCWEAADGFPSELSALFANSSVEAFRQIELLLAFPEYKVPLPGGGRASQTDVFSLGRDAEGELVAIAVEGKVNEPFGPTLTEWDAASSEGKRQRLAYIQKMLELSGELPGEVRYQLLHRTASAVTEAYRFNARSAVMIVHSFSQEDHWFEEYLTFLRLYGQAAEVGELVRLTAVQGVALYSGF